MSLLNDCTFIFIIGSPRSGTTWLHRVLASHPDVASVTAELHHFNMYVKPLREAWATEKADSDAGKWTLGYPFLMDEEKFMGMVKRMTEEVYTEVRKTNPSATHILDKHPGYTFALDHIIATVPNARFIHLLRDGRDVVTSSLAAFKKGGFGQGNVYGAAHKWARSVKTAQQFLKGHPDKGIEIRYEELLADSETHLQSILKACQLNNSPEIMTKLTDPEGAIHQRVSAPDQKKGEMASKWRNLSVQERFLMEEIAGDVLRANGYVDTTDWWSLGGGDKLNRFFYKSARGIRNAFRSSKATD